MRKKKGSTSKAKVGHTSGQGIAFELLSGGTVPSRQTAGAVGYDLCAAEPVRIRPGEQHIIPTGVRIAIPEGFEGQVRSRSGLAANNQVYVLNSPGTIDPDYRGEIKVILRNAGRVVFVVKRHDRIAQLVISPVATPELVQVDDLDKTARGSGGLGSTGR